MSVVSVVPLLADEPRRAGERPCRLGGFVTTQFVLAVALSLMLFVMLCNAIVYQYGRGVVRAALDEGVRSASRAGGTVSTCEAAAEEVRHTLLGGPVGSHVAIRCGLVADTIQATATGYLPSWLPLVPDWSIDLAASAVKEPFDAAGPLNATGPPPASTTASSPRASSPRASSPRASSPRASSPTGSTASSPTASSVGAAP
jgi:hypothetical protein